jgi:hypothetical protein
MKKIIATLLLAIIFTGTTLGQDLSQDRDHQNFIRNYKRAEKAYSERNSCQTPRCFAAIEKYTMYSKRFLEKLKTKFGGEKFSKELKQIEVMENYLALQNNQNVGTRQDLDYVLLWIYRFSPTSINSLNPLSNLKEFNEAKLKQAFQNVRETKEFRSKVKAEDLENFLAALNDFDSYLKKTEVFYPEKGMVGMQIARSKEIQDKDYFIKTLTLAKNYLESLTLIAGNGKNINEKLTEVNNLIQNADGQIKINKPKPEKKYKDPLPVAVVRDKNLEKEFIEAIRFQKFPGVTITGAIITGPNWMVQKSPDLRAVYRWREATVVARTSDGDCWFQKFSFKQAQTGSGYGKAVRSASGARFYIECSKIK